ncbi:MAG: orotate phosphoribosyltransferase [archaeon]
MSKPEIEQEFLNLLLRKGGLRIAPNAHELFVFKSGRRSPNFINIGALTDGESLAKIRWAFGNFIANLLNEGKLQDFDFIFGPAYKGIGLAALACEGLSELRGINKRYLYDRKEEKVYADRKMDQIIVGSGYFKPGDKILIIDDVITTGDTKLESIEKLRVLGEHKVVGLVLAVDREEKMGDAEQVERISAVQNIEEQFGIKVFSILSMKRVFDLVKDEISDDIRRIWIDYYDRYGVENLI